jgi:peptidoglycan/xylan/chitin deacetylase (PgdA/CDA1 family)
MSTISNKYHKGYLKDNINKIDNNKVNYRESQVFYNSDNKIKSKIIQSDLIDSYISALESKIEEKTNNNEMISALKIDEKMDNKDNNIRTQAIYRGVSGSKKVAITFDDTPSPETLRKLINFAKENNVKMVFFVNTKRLNKESVELLKEGLSTGLIRIGNHTHSHNTELFKKLNTKNINLSEEDKKLISKEIDDWEETLKNYGIEDKHLKHYFRPPGGGGGYKNNNSYLLDELSSRGYKYLPMWDVEFIYSINQKKKQDPSYEYNAKNIEDILVNRVEETKGGNLVLLHFKNEDVEGSLNAIKKLKDKGYNFVFPEELLKDNQIIDSKKS